MSQRSSTYGNKSFFNYDISEERREKYRATSEASRKAKAAAMSGTGPKPAHAINSPRLDPGDLMPFRSQSDFTALSLFSGGGGLDLGFERAGFRHSSSYDIVTICGSTLTLNRPNWNVFAGADLGDVRRVDWSVYRGAVDVIHGGPPCQPFSIAGQQRGLDDERNMWGEYVRCIHSIVPLAFVGENVLGLLDPKFTAFVENEIITPLSDFHIHRFQLNAADFGVPQARRRAFFVGFRHEKHSQRFIPPCPTHDWSRFRAVGGNGPVQEQLFCDTSISTTMGVREALGLPDIGFDALAPTLRSGFTGKRNTTSILNSTASQRAWHELGIWASGVQPNPEMAHKFPSANGDFRLAVQDCGIIQGFPRSWSFAGAVYQVLGQIGNSVAPPVAYRVANAIRHALEA